MMAASQPPLPGVWHTSAEALLSCMSCFLVAGEAYRQSSGIHTVAPCKEGRLILVAEDIDRHNAVDKIAGQFLIARVACDDAVLISTGRVSSEMMTKCRRMGIPVVASRSAATAAAVGRADEFRICLVGYVRGHSMNMYTHAWRLT